MLRFSVQKLRSQKKVSLNHHFIKRSLSSFNMDHLHQLSFRRRNHLRSSRMYHQSKIVFDNKNVQNDDNNNNVTDDFPPISEGLANFDALLKARKTMILLEIYMDEQENGKLSSLRNEVQKYEGYVYLVRVKMSELGGAGQQLGVHDTPVALCFYNGQQLTFRASAMMDSDMQKTFINNVLAMAYSTEWQPIREQANNALMEGKIEESARLFNKLIETHHYCVPYFGLAGLALCAIQGGDVETALSLIETIKNKYPDALEDKWVKTTVNKVELKSQNKSSGNIQDLEAKIQQNEDDLETRYLLGLEYEAMNDHERAINTLLEVVKRDMKRGEYFTKSKETLLKIFNSLDSDDELATKGRRKLGNYLF